MKGGDGRGYSGRGWGRGEGGGGDGWADGLSLDHVRARIQTPGHREQENVEKQRNKENKRKNIILCEHITTLIFLH